MVVGGKGIVFTMGVCLTRRTVGGRAYRCPCNVVIQFFFTPVAGTGGGPAGIVNVGEGGEGEEEEQERGEHCEANRGELVNEFSKIAFFLPV